MNNRTATFRVCMILALCSIMSFGLGKTMASQSDDDDFRNRLATLHEKIDAVAVALEACDGFPKRSGLIDLQIARFFAEYIAWELDHPEMMKDALLSSETFQETPDFSRQERQRRYRAHIDRELTGSTEILDQALARSNRDVAWPKVPEIDWSRMRYEDDHFRVGRRVVFPYGFNMLTRSLVDVSENPEWAKKAEIQTRSFLQEMQSLGVSVVGAGVSVPSLVMPDGSVDKARIEQLVDIFRKYGRMGLKVDVLLHWSGDKETLERLWPGITKFRGNGVYLDIDHPGTRVMTARVMAHLMPALRDVPSIVSWDMANEPFFYLDGWSPHTLQKYHAWLAERYTTIDELNTVWQTDYARFDEIPAPKVRSRGQCSPGQWYDRVTFHNRRVTEFFEFVQTQIRKHIPDAVIHLKGQDNSSLGPLPEAVTDGIDREMLTAMANLHGLDTRPLPATEPRMAAKSRDATTSAILDYDDSHYGFHWLGQSFLYDYLTSLEPHRPIVDFEYHAFSINAIRVPDIRPSHARASLWMAHLHGLVGNVAWYWHRRYGPDPFPGKYFRMWLYGSISTQPKIAAEYFHTMSMLNTFAEEVAALAAEPDRPVRLFVSKPSYIQNQAHINALHRAYEGVCFHGLRVGFVTERMLADGGVLSDCKLLVIPDAEYVSTPALRALHRAKQTGVRLVRFGKRATAYNEHGIAHSPKSLAFLNDLPVLDYGSAPKLSEHFGKLLQPLTTTLPVCVNVAGRNDAFGVMHRQVQIDGNVTLLLVNVSDSPVRVQLRSKDDRPVKGFDMLNAENVQGTDLAMPLQGVRLIRCSRPR